MAWSIAADRCDKFFALAAMCIAACGSPSEQFTQKTASVTLQTETAIPVCTPPPTGIVAWWPGDGNAKDIVGGHDGTPTNGATFDGGLVSDAFAFDGASGYVSLPSTAWNFGGGDFSVEFWERSSNGSSRMHALSFEPSYGTRNLDFDFNDDDLGYPVGLWLYWNSNGFNLITAGTGGAYTNGQWHHIALTRNGSQLTLYVDGSVVGSATYSASIDLSGSAINYIGAGQTGGTSPSHFWLGSIDEVTLYDRSLTATEIQAIYNAGSAGKCKRRKIASPVAGAIEVKTSAAQCSGAIWCFNEHRIADSTGQEISSLPGVCGANDKFGWDINLNSPARNSDAGRPVFSIASGRVAATYGGCINASSSGSDAQVLIEHQDRDGRPWWTGYLHMKDLHVSPGDIVTEGSVIGLIGDVGANNEHLHFVVYEGSNARGQLQSVDAEIVPRLDADGDTVPDDVDLCVGQQTFGADADFDGCIDTLDGLKNEVQSVGLSGEVVMALMASLLNAEASIADGNTNAARGQIRAFLNKVSARRGHTIPRNVADLFTAYALNVFNSLH